MTRSLNVTPKTTLRSGKSEAKVTIVKDSARVIILLRLTNDGHEASRGLSATAELLVIICFEFDRLNRPIVVSQIGLVSVKKNGVTLKYALGMVIENGTVRCIAYEFLLA